jgi:V8-like Glu-specific endopeptidase
MTLQENGVQRIANDGRELFYRASTPLGAAGAPIFNRRMDLIGIHMGNASGWLNIGVKRAISTQALFEWVRTRPRLGRLSEAT